MIISIFTLRLRHFAPRLPPTSRTASIPEKAHPVFVKAVAIPAWLSRIGAVYVSPREAYQLYAAVWLPSSDEMRFDLFHVHNGKMTTTILRNAQTLAEFCAALHAPAPSVKASDLGCGFIRNRS